MLTQLTRGVCGTSSQAKNRGFLAGFAVLFAAAIFSFSLAGCGDDGGSNNNPTVTGVVVSAAGNASSVAKGGTLQFSAVVDGTNNPSQAVTWAIITSGTAQGTGISSSGLLTVAAGETNAMITVKATSAEDTAKSITRTVTVVSGGSISSVTVNAASSVAKGGTLQFSAAVAGPGTDTPDQAVTWTITTTGIAEGTGISESGLLTVAADETAASITVKAASAVDSAKSGDKTVTVTEPGSGGPPTYTVTSVTVNAASSVNAGETLQFSATVTGTNNPDQTVTWSITTDGTASGTSISSAGLLTVAAGETKDTIAVTATSVEDSTGSTKSGTKTVTVIGAPTITSVTVSAAGNAAGVARGGTLQFSATVTGTNNPVKTVTWTITTSGTASGTSISSNGLLTVAANESKASIEVKATSALDTTKSGTMTVMVTGGSSSTELEGTWSKSSDQIIISGSNWTFKLSGKEVLKGTFTIDKTAQTFTAVSTHAWARIGDEPGHWDEIPSSAQSQYTATVHYTLTGNTLVISQNTNEAEMSMNGTWTKSGGSAPTVASVLVSAAGSATSVAKGGTLQFTAVVVGTNNPAQTVTWSINTSGTASGTSISSAGLLTVAAGETNGTITVRATPTADPTIVGIKTVTVTGGSSGGGGEHGLPPEPGISVDLSLPSIQTVPSFSGTFVSSEQEARELVLTAYSEMSYALSDLEDDDDYIEPFESGNVRGESYGRTVNHENILSGAELTGFSQWKWTESAADADNPGDTVGDWNEDSERTKFAVEFKNFIPKYETAVINGKYTMDQSYYTKAVVTAINPETTGDVTVSLNISEQCAASISQDGKGLKFVMRIEGKMTERTIKNVNEDSYPKLGDLFDSFTLTIDIYNSSNQKQQQYSKAFTSYDAAMAYLHGEETSQQSLRRFKRTF